MWFDGTVKLTALVDNRVMNTYKRHRFPPDIISYTVWLYHRFNQSHHDIEDLLAAIDRNFWTPIYREYRHIATRAR